MPTEIDSKQLQDLLQGRDAQLVEVLPHREYEEEHLPGAISIPLKSFTSERLSQLDRHKPVIVYCWDDD
jgi:rhodanese-related sulfurtransferase